MALSLLLMLGLGVQSCSAVVGGAIATGLRDARGDDLSAAGFLGILAAFLWLVGASLVLGKPRVSMWLFASAVPLCVIGGALGFGDLYIWAGASALFSLGSWRGITERDRELAEREAAALPAPQAAWHPDPWGEKRLRWYDGREWTPHISD
jgi:hypothetical protein